MANLALAVLQLPNGLKKNNFLHFCETFCRELDYATKFNAQLMNKPTNFTVLLLNSLARSLRLHLTNNANLRSMAKGWRPLFDNQEYVARN